LFGTIFTENTVDGKEEGGGGGGRRGKGGGREGRFVVDV
jgi:hypothetical protein